MTPTPGLVVDDVTLTYPDGAGTVDALDHVCLEVAPGNLTAVVGPSGSGKSSLLAVAATLVTPTAGRVFVNGIEATALGESGRTRLRREEVGIVFQQPNLIPALTATENLVIGDRLRGRRKKQDSVERARALLDRVGLAEAGNRRPHQLSGGQRQRVNIARALMNRPSVLLVDEPTAALDHERSAAIIELLREVTDEFSVATVLVTHDTEFLGSTDTVASMRDGALSTPAPTAAVVPA